MDKKHDLVVHRFRSSGKVDIIRLSSARLLGKTILAAVILVLVTTAGSFLVFMRMFPQEVVVQRPPKPAEEKPAARPAPPALPPQEEAAPEAPKPAAEADVQPIEPERSSSLASHAPVPPLPPPDVDVRNFKMRAEGEDLRVSLTVNNAHGDGSAVSGYVVMVLSTKNGNAFTYPEVGLDEEGNPKDYKGGRRFTIKWLIVLNARFPVPIEDVERVSVYYYDPAGRLRMVKGFDESGKPIAEPS